MWRCVSPKACAAILRGLNPKFSLKRAGIRAADAIHLIDIEFDDGKEAPHPKQAIKS